MRVVLGVLSLLVVVAVVGFLARKQVKSVSEIQVPVLSAPTDTATPPAVSATGNVQQQSQAIQQQFKAAAEVAVQQARPVPDDK